MTGGYQAGNGYVTLTPGLAYAAPVLSGTNFINVPGTWSVNGTSYYYNTGSVGVGTSSPTQKLDVRGNLRLGDDGGSSATATGQALEFVGPGFSTDPVGLYRVNPAADQSELHVVVGDVADANDKFVVGRMPGTTAEGGIPTGTGTPTSTLQVNGSVAASIRTLNSGTIAATDYTVIVGGNVSLPAPDATNVGRLYHLLYNSTAGSVTFTVAGSFRDPSNGGPTNSFQLSGATNSKGITVQSDGTQWWIVTRE